jgi:protein-tyrosine phosphatase
MPIRLESEPHLRIVAFKCPQGKHNDIYIPRAKRLPPWQLYEHYRAKNIRLKHVIDLTNTDRYYFPSDLSHMGVKHHKLALAGKVIPNEDFCNRFNEIIKECMSGLKLNEFIGVHCTHGINRTGFMVVQMLC